MARQFKIVDGPSKWDLMLALFDCDPQHWRKVTFSLEGSEGPRILRQFVINGLEKEDGSGEHWNLTGHIGSLTAQGFFSTKTRTGWIRY